MGYQITDEENERRLNQLTQDSFNMAIDAPYGWLNCALQLKCTADKINFMDTNNKDIALLSVHRFLMALSFENLLKGLVIAHGTPYDETWGKTHNLQALLNRLKTSQLQISNEEQKLLEGLEKFIVWQGRYPIPIPSKAQDYEIAISISSTEIQLERNLWKRLVENLKQTGWANKLGQQIPLSRVWFLLEE